MRTKEVLQLHPMVQCELEHRLKEAKMVELKRRFFTLAAPAFWASGANAKAKTEKPLVLMVGHSASPEWKSWLSGEGRIWMQSAQFRNVEFERIALPEGSHALSPSVWPASYRWVVKWSMGNDAGAAERNEDEWVNRYRSVFGPGVEGPLHFYVVSRDRTEYAWTHAGWANLQTYLVEFSRG